MLLIFIRIFVRIQTDFQTSCHVNGGYSGSYVFSVWYLSWNHINASIALIRAFDHSALKTQRMQIPHKAPPCLPTPQSML